MIPFFKKQTSAPATLAALFGSSILFASLRAADPLPNKPATPVPATPALTSPKPATPAPSPAKPTPPQQQPSNPAASPNPKPAAATPSATPAKPATPAPATPPPTTPAAKAAPAATPIPIPALQKKVDFETNVLPIFKRNCLSCHNQTDAEGDLVLETPASILKGGEDGQVVAPHKGLDSLLLQTAARRTKPYMPPKNNKVGAETLTADELAVLKAWIDQGATGTVSTKTKPVQWRPLPPGLHPILALAVTNDGQFAACGRANQIFVYQVATGRVVARLTDPKLLEKSSPKTGFHGSAQRDFVQSLTFSPDGRLLASGEYRMVKLWQREPNLPQFALGSDPSGVVATSPDGKWIATSAKDNVIHIWEAATGKPTKNLSGHTGKITSLKFSPDSARLASGSADKTLRVWDVADGSVFAEAETASEISAVAWTMGGKQLASGGGDTLLRLWELPPQAGGVLKAGKGLTGHTKPVTCLEPITADGKQLLSGSEDGTVRCWAIDQARQLRQMDHGAPVVSIAVSPGPQNSRFRRRKFGAPLEGGQRPAARRNERRSHRAFPGRYIRAGRRIRDKRSRLLEDRNRRSAQSSDRKSGRPEESHGRAGGG